MARVFLSHSSKDKQFARRVKEHLERMGHEMWFDEDQLKVGDPITIKIGEGLDRAEYVLVVLSKNAVSSGWVEREWSTKVSQEIEDGKVRILPARIDECVIPAALRDKVYADFRGDFETGLEALSLRLGRNESDTSRDESDATRDELESAIQNDDMQRMFNAACVENVGGEPHTAPRSAE